MGPDESGVVRGVSSKGAVCLCCLCGAPVVTHCEVINFDLYWFSLGKPETGLQMISPNKNVTIYFGIPRIHSPNKW